MFDRSRGITVAIALCWCLVGAGKAGAAEVYRPASEAGYDPYVASYVNGFRYVPWPIDEAAPSGPKHRVPVYMYGYFGARKRQEPKICQGYNDYIRGIRRGYNW